ncbi:hypothetical protein TNCV_659151 [Trichonephila clavipes]|nr:hypothetical protein TNCV_659151 [Trichonephila clavipes]
MPIVLMNLLSLKLSPPYVRSDCISSYEPTWPITICVSVSSSSSCDAGSLWREEFGNVPMETADRLPETRPGLHKEVHYAGCSAPSPMSFSVLIEDLIFRGEH